MDTKIDDAIKFKKEQIEKIEKKLSDLKIDLKKLEEKKKSSFCNELIAEIHEKGLTLNNETIQSLLLGLDLKGTTDRENNITSTIETTNITEEYK